MHNTDIEKQREIGKQLFLIDIVHYENDRSVEGGLLILSRDRLAAWASMTRDEIDQFLGFCATMDPHNMPMEIVKKSYEEGIYKPEIDDSGALGFLLSTYRYMGSMFINFVKIEGFEDDCGKLALSNYKRWCECHEEYKLNESYASPELFEKLIRFYIKSFVEIVAQALSEGYDWDVITAMLRIELTKERYNRLAEVFCSDFKKQGTVCYASKTSEVCAVIKAFNDIGKTLDETIEYILGKSEYKGITEEYITEKYNMFSAKH